MDLQFYGANCVAVVYKGTRLVVDDNLTELGAKSVTKADDVALFTGTHGAVTARLVIDGPGEYETADISIIGIAARAHTDEEGKKSATMFKIMAGDSSVLLTGHIHPELGDDLLERIGVVDALVVPVGGHGYTLDPVGAQRVIKAIEPKLVVPTHYDEKGLTYPVPQLSLEDALKEIGLEKAADAVSKLKIKTGELPEVTQLALLERS
ncbi:MAG TPA: MBL fold metallo-hydrolase [Candidatus Saccharimonadales bacterium]|nr:MBL fold metallo-hydrolase [Candidatus Saccharimonadales bacterium]